MSETATRRRHWIPAPVLRTTATLSYVLLAAGLIATVRFDILEPFDMVRLLAAQLAIAVTLELWVSVRRINNWHDWIGVILVLLVSRSLIHLASGTINAVPDARAHLDNMAGTLVSTGFIPEPRRFFTTGDYHLYPVLHMNLTAMVRVVGYDIYPMSAVFSLFLTLALALIIAATARRWVPGLELLAVVCFAAWARFILVGSLLQPIAVGSVLIAYLFLLLPKASYPRTLFLFLLGVFGLTLTHHYSSWMGLSAIAAAVILPYLLRDIGKLFGALPNPRTALIEAGFYPLRPAPLLRLNLPFVLYAVILGYWTVGSGDIKEFVNFQGIFRFEQTETFVESRSVRFTPTVWLSLFNYMDSVLPIASLFVATAVAWRTRARVAPVTAGLLGFAILIAVGFVYRPFLPARTQAMAGVLGGLFMALLFTARPVVKRLPVALMLFLVFSMFGFSSVNAISYMYPWTQREPLPLPQEEPDEELAGFMFYALPQRALPRSEGGIGAIVFASTGFLIYPERSASSIQWIWPPLLPDAQLQSQYWLLEDEALEFGTRAPANFAANEARRQLFIRYPTQEMADTFERTRRVMDDGRYVLWYPTFE